MWPISLSNILNSYPLLFSRLLNGSQATSYDAEFIAIVTDLATALGSNSHTDA